jgi:hypothetical protein
MTAASQVKPRLQLHRGTVVAAALWFDPALLGEREARRRVLAAWAPAAGVFEVAGGLLLRLPRPVRLSCSQAPGLPLTLEDGVLVSAPLRPDERARLAPPAGAVVLVRAGRAEVHPLQGARQVDVAAWLDVSAWQPVAVEGLGAPPPPVAVALEPVAAPARTRFGAGVPPLAPEAQAMLARMEGKPVPARAQASSAVARETRPSRLARFFAWLFGAAPASSRTVDGARAAQPSRAVVVVRPSLLARLVSWLRGGAGASATPATPVSSSALARASTSASEQGSGGPSALAQALGRMLRALFGASSQAQAGPSGAQASQASAPARPTQPPPPRGPGLLSRLQDWALRSTPLGRMLGQRKADYVRRLFEMFEEGDLQQALRYAIPLGGGTPSEEARVALGLPGPRETLSINLQRGGPGSIFGSGAEVFAALKERYRAAFQRLEREGKIDEAAFVLTELLGAHEEAVSFLERHGRLRLAAELAEARGMAPGLVVRQWFLARDVARAVALARRSGAFADALARLERSHPAEARKLRLLWAETLAEAGDFSRAVDVVWPLPEARALARGWLELGVALGGVAGARHLARLVTGFPAEFPAVREQVLALLADESQERAAERVVFSDTLVLEPVMELRAALAGPVVRALLRDKAAGWVREQPRSLSTLLREADHGTLRADVPPNVERFSGGPAPWSTLVNATLSLAEAGAHAVHDAVSLPDGRLLVALGEAGVRLLRADGTPLADFDVPAFSLVPALHGGRVLALAPRGELRRISRLDLGERRAVRWCDARVDAFAPVYDGNLWFIADGSTVMAVDALTVDWRALWRVGQVGHRVAAMALDAERLSFLAEDAQGIAGEVWTYALPAGPVLRSRVPVRSQDSFAHAVLLPDGNVELPLHPMLALAPPWRAFCTQREQGWETRLTQGAVHRGSLRFEGPHPVRARFSGGALLLFDSVGRLLRVDLAQGSVRRLRVL